MIEALKVEPDWQKMAGLIPAIIQHAENGGVLMLAYMNKEAYLETLSSTQLTLFSRSKNRLWRKGETSGNTMTVTAVRLDCDGDSLLVQVLPKGPACHLGFTSCFQPTIQNQFSFMITLTNLIAHRAALQQSESYTSVLLNSGINRCAQKVGEEAVETVIAAINNDKNELINESADLLYHLMVLLQVRNLSILDVIECLENRHHSK